MINGAFNINSTSVDAWEAFLSGTHELPVQRVNEAGRVIGFTGDALVAVRDDSKVGLKQRTQLKKLVAAENADRNAMYKSIAKANGHPEWEPDVRKTFARTWVEQAASGWWYQNADGKWQQK